MIKYDFKDSKVITDKIDEKLEKLEESCHKYATNNFIEILEKAYEQEEELNITSVGENIFFHSIHFLRDRGWEEQKLLDAVKQHYHLYDEDTSKEKEENK